MRTRWSRCSCRTSARVTWEEIGWTIALGLAGAVITQIIRRIGLTGAQFFPKKPFVLIPLAGLVVAGLAILFAETTTHGVNEVLFSGQDALPGSRRQRRRRGRSARSRW